MSSVGKIFKGTLALITGTTGAAASLNATNVANAATVKVKQGQTLKSIADQNGISVKKLAADNHLTNINQQNINTPLKANTKLNVPKIPETYTVQKGDTVSAIAQKFGLRTSTLLRLNHLGWDSTIYIGDKLKLREPQHPQPKPVTVQNNNVSTPTDSVQGSTLGVKAANLAIQLSKQHIPYVWGGESLQGMDCSGLVEYVYSQLGVQLPHNTVAQEHYVNYESVSQAKPGDLLFWGSQGNSYHVAIYIGNGRYVAAPDYNQDVQIQTISSGFTPNFAGSLR